MSEKRETFQKLPFDETDANYFQALTTSPNVPYAYFGDKKWMLPFDLDVDYIRNDLKVYSDDVWIVTPPKCGTTWTQEIVWHISTGVDEESAKRHQFYRVPFLEYEKIKFVASKSKRPDFNSTPKNAENVLQFMEHSIEFVEKMERPRIIKTHLPFELLPQKMLDTCKVIYVGRNVKDAAVSRFYHRQMRGFVGTFPQLAELFKSGKQTYNPFFYHVLDAWQCKGHANVYFTMYEEMKRDLAKVICDMAAFLGKQLSDTQVNRILELVDIDTFRKNKFVNMEKELEWANKTKTKFIRKGIVGDWKNHFTPEMNVEWDAWINEQLKDSGLRMVFEQ